MCIWWMQKKYLLILHIHISFLKNTSGLFKIILFFMNQPFNEQKETDKHFFRKIIYWFLFHVISYQFQSMAAFWLVRL